MTKAKFKNIWITNHMSICDLDIEFLCALYNNKSDKQMLTIRYSSLFDDLRPLFEDPSSYLELSKTIGRRRTWNFDKQKSIIFEEEKKTKSPSPQRVWTGLSWERERDRFNQSSNSKLD